MITLFKTTLIEPSIDLLAKHFHKVLYAAAFYNRQTIGLRADLLKEKRVWFWKTNRQRELWDDEGGVMLRWHYAKVEHPHDAIFLGECPRNTDLLDQYCKQTRVCGVVYIPPTWRLHREVLEYRNQGKPEIVIQRKRDQLQRVIDLVEKLPTLTPYSLRRLLSALPASPPPSSFPGSLAAAVLPVDTSPEAP